MTVELVWEAISGVVMMIGGALIAVGLLIRHRWYDRQDEVYRAAGIVFGILLGPAGRRVGSARAVVNYC